MTAPVIQKDGIGTEWDMTVVDEDGDAVDISTATDKEYRFIAPDETVLTVDADFNPDGTGTGSDGKLRWVGTGVELAQEGRWKWQARVTLPSEFYATNQHAYYVRANIEEPEE